MDLRLRLAARIPLAADGLRVTGAGRNKMLAELPSDRLARVVAVLAERYSLGARSLNWQETPEPEGHNNGRFATYQMVVPGAAGHPALLASLWLMLPGAR